MFALVVRHVPRERVDRIPNPQSNETAGKSVEHTPFPAKNAGKSVLKPSFPAYFSDELFQNGDHRFGQNCQGFFNEGNSHLAAVENL